MTGLSGRKKDHIWNYFEEEKTKTDKGVRVKAKCKACGKILQGLVARLRAHKDKCFSASVEDPDPEAVSSKTENTDAAEPKPLIRPSSSDSPAVNPSCATKRQLSDGSSSSSSRKSLKITSSMDSYVVKTSKKEKEVIDKQIARGIYATNTSFRAIEHPEVIKSYNMLRPGYNPPTRKDIAGPLLDSVYQEEIENCSGILEDQVVTMCIDGWSNVHNEPIVCACVTTQSGGVYLTETIDTSGNSHTGEYLAEITLATMTKTEKQFKCKVRSFVSDNASNMTKMRHELEKNDNNVDVLTYGCSAHILNLLAKDLEIRGVKEHILQIVKFFRNHHLPRAYLAAEGKGALVMPQDVRWNTLSDCLESYIKNWPVLMKICEEHRDVIDADIRNKVVNLGIKRNAEDLLNILKPIAVALDKIQKNNCTISDAVVIWKDLEKSLHDLLDAKGQREFCKRYNMALTPAHFLASLLDPRMPVGTLSHAESEAALEFAEEKYADTTTLIPLVIKFQARSEPFTGTMFHKGAVTNITAVEWWQSFKAMKKDVCTKREMECIIQLMTAIASSAGVERFFSTFNLVHSKLRNRLGVEKAAKLVFLMKLLNNK